MPDDFLDKIASVKIEQQDDVETTNSDNGSGKRGRKVELKVLHYEILDEDSELTVFVKEMINEAKITNNHVYQALGRAEGWNMIYGLKKGVSWERVKKWAEVTGNTIELYRKKNDE